MKKFALGMLIMFNLNFVCRLSWYVGLDTDNTKLVDIGFYLSNIIQGTPVIEVITGRCRPDKYDGNRRTYFECNKVQIKISDLIYGDK